MKLIKCSCFVIIIFIITCIGNQTIITADEVTEFNKSIFDKLLSDIYETPEYYKDNKKFIIEEEFSDNHLVPDKVIVVRNKFVEIRFWPDYYSHNLEKYIPMIVYIKNKTSDFILGKYIGESINVLINEYNDNFNINTYGELIWYNYGYNKEMIWLSIRVENNIIIEIQYGKAN